MWLISSPNLSKPPSQLPIILQVCGLSTHYCPHNPCPHFLSIHPSCLFPPPLPSQFLLSQAHRLQALELLGRYLDMGPEAVYAVSSLSTVWPQVALQQLCLFPQALSVGIFPYILKLLASKLRELQPILVFIWAKILAVDPVRHPPSSFSSHPPLTCTCTSLTFLPTMRWLSASPPP